METGTIEREIHIDASPEVVFDVVSNPEHVREWWPTEADYPAEPGGAGRIGFPAPPAGGTGRGARPGRGPAAPAAVLVRLAPGGGGDARPGDSVPVVFELEPAGDGTRLRMTESGFRERGWDEA